MLAAQHQVHQKADILPVDALILPGWVRAQFGDVDSQHCGPAASMSMKPTAGIDLHTRQTDRLMLITVRVRDAVALAPLVLQQRTATAYEAVRVQLTADHLRHPIRIWNLIPDIHGAMPGGIDRYMVFNAGRYAAYHDWYHSDTEFGASMATATAVGYQGTDLIVHVLAGDQPGKSVGNPRQVQAYRYSTTYGPLPPCFARATMVQPSAIGVRTLLIGGTSSVCGESSMHLNDVAAQTRETLVNIAHLIAAAERTENGGARITGTVDTDVQLRQLDSLRIYFTHVEHLNTILGVVLPHVDHLAQHRVDVVQADICRSELLVEIEGTAMID